MNLFVTGTDTDAGKTYISCAILNWLNEAGYTTIGSKPFASGCTLSDGKYFNDDALKLQQASSIQLKYHLVNPVTLPEPTAPHIAAKKSGLDLSKRIFKKHLDDLSHYKADYHVIEGAGGWLVPLNDNETLGSMVAHFNIPVILVVGIRLGCINHSLLTAQAIYLSGAKLTGWIANCIDPDMLYIEETIESIESRIAPPRLATVGHNGSLICTKPFLIPFKIHRLAINLLNK